MNEPMDTLKFIAREFDYLEVVDATPTENNICRRLVKLGLLKVENMDYDDIFAAKHDFYQVYRFIDG